MALLPSVGTLDPPCSLSGRAEDAVPRQLPPRVHHAGRAGGANAARHRGHAAPSVDGPDTPLPRRVVHGDRDCDPRALSGEGRLRSAVWDVLGGMRATGRDAKGSSSTCEQGEPVPFSQPKMLFPSGVDKQGRQFPPESSKPVRTPGSTNRHAHSAFMPPSLSTFASGLPYRRVPSKSFHRVVPEHFTGAWGPFPLSSHCCWRASARQGVQKEKRQAQKRGNQWYSGGAGAVEHGLLAVGPLVSQIGCHMNHAKSAKIAWQRAPYWLAVVGRYCCSCRQPARLSNTCQDLLLFPTTKFYCLRQVHLAENPGQ